MAALIRQGLEEEAYAVDVVNEGRQTLDWLRLVDYDLEILDLMLPWLDGLQVCREYRVTGGRTPILILTARNTLLGRIIGLDSGADDYLGKPFGMPELLTRLRALTRREGPSKTVELHVQDLTLDTTTKCVSRDGKLIELTATEYALLEFLMRHGDKFCHATRLSIISGMRISSRDRNSSRSISDIIRNRQTIA